MDKFKLNEIDNILRECQGEIIDSNLKLPISQLFIKKHLIVTEESIDYYKVIRFKKINLTSFGINLFELENKMCEYKIHTNIECTKTKCKNEIHYSNHNNDTCKSVECCYISNHRYSTDDSYYLIRFNTPRFGHNYYFVKYFVENINENIVRSWWCYCDSRGKRYVTAKDGLDTFNVLGNDHYLKS